MDQDTSVGSGAASGGEDWRAKVVGVRDSFGRQSRRRATTVAAAALALVLVVACVTTFTHSTTNGNSLSSDPSASATPGSRPGDVDNRTTSTLPGGAPLLGNGRDD